MRFSAVYSIIWNITIPLICFTPGAESYILSVPAWNEFVQAERPNLEAIAHQIDILKEIANYDCPVGGGPVFLPVLEFIYRRSLLRLLEVFDEARLSFRMLFAKMDQLAKMAKSKNSAHNMVNPPATTPAVTLQKMLDAGWDELWPNPRVKKLLDEIHLVAANGALLSMRISNYINDLPGWEHADTITDQANIDNLARVIDSDGEFTIGDNVEGIIVGPELERSRAVLKRTLRSFLQFFQTSRMQFKTYANNASISMANPELVDLLRSNDPNHGGGDTPFTFADLLGNIVKWFDCWIPELQDLIYLVDQLGALPGPEPEGEQDQTQGVIGEIGDTTHDSGMEIEDGGS
ncbi:hypothetical protein TWF481_005063 [Arthrobotrys musiformis]|uniref:Uncharacterized protein n=1 Tax=Arthrobotrys musiformis TaxID=47236 RepID=A0AAV9WET3_9PEZI